MKKKVLSLYPTGTINLSVYHLYRWIKYVSTADMKQLRRGFMYLVLQLLEAVGQQKENKPLYTQSARGGCNYIYLPIYLSIPPVCIDRGIYIYIHTSI